MTVLMVCVVAADFCAARSTEQGAARSGSKLVGKLSCHPDSALPGLLQTGPCAVQSVQTGERIIICAGLQSFDKRFYGNQLESPYLF